MLLALFIALSVAIGGPLAAAGVHAQDAIEATDVAEEPAETGQPPVEEEMVIPEPPPAEEPQPEPEQPLVEEPAPENEGATQNESASENEATPDAEIDPDAGLGDNDQLLVSTEAPSVPALFYSPAEQPNCVPSASQAAIILHGADLDYDCTFALAFTGEHLAPADIALDWTARATVEGGWAVQLLPPPVDPQIPPEWTAALADTQFAYRGNVWDTPSSETADSLDATSELTFGLRIHRAVCSVEPQTVRLDLAVDASLPALAEATVERLRQQPDPYRIAPELAPIPEPSVAFTGTLDFGEILLTSEGPVTPLEPATAQLTISSLDQACGDYRLEIASTPPNGAEEAAGAEGIAQSSIGLALTTIDDAPLPDGDCAFADGCLIATVAAGPEASPATTITLGVSLVLPDQPRAAVFDLSLTAALEHVTPAEESTVAALPERANGSS